MSTSTPQKCPQCGRALPANAPAGLCPNCVMALNFATETAVTGEAAAAAVPPLSPEELAQHFPQLEILECLGRGGMGVVYKARQKSLSRLVALKLLAPERANDPEFAGRFAREAQALAQLDHPHIVTVYDFGQTNGFFYLLMEFVDGVNLRQLLRARKLAPEEALAIVPPLCEALQFAHEGGIVHRDIKPENLLLAKDGRVKIADFGIAKMLGAGAQTGGDQAAGTPGYMAPEQMETPPRVDSRADIYSLGVVIYEMLTGERPATPIEPPSSRVRGMQIDVRIDDIVLRALEAKPELRFQTAAELRTELETVTASTSKQSPPPKAAGSTAPPPIAPANPWPRRIFLLLAALLCVPVLLVIGLVVPYFLAARSVRVSTDERLTGSENSKVSQNIDFKVTGVEVRASTRSILVHFERDNRPGLGLEISQDMTPAADGTVPDPGYRTWQEKTWIDEKDPRVLQWTLPAEFTEDELRTAAAALEKRARQFRQLPEGAMIEFATVEHRRGWKYHLVARVNREPEPPVAASLEMPIPPAPPGALFSAEQQVVVPAESRVSVEILQSANDVNRKPVHPKLNFKTAIGSGLGVLLRWHAYGPDHPTHANRWLLDLVDPQNGIAFYRMGGGFPSAVRMSTPDIRPLPEKNDVIDLITPSTWAPLRILRVEEPAPPGAPLRAWWQVEAWVTWVSPVQEGDPPMFQLPSSPPRTAPSGTPSPPEKHEQAPPKP